MSEPSLSLTTVRSPKILPSRIPIEEEMYRHYNPKAFYPVIPGEVFHNSYKAIVKLGFGSHSTVWLAEDLREDSHGYVAIKFKNCDHVNEESAEHELDISQHIATADPSSTGFGAVRTVEDDFEAETHYGKHKCLVYLPMRESLCTYRQRFEDNKLPVPILKAYSKILLLGLSYLHSTCGVVHTDLKLENILVTFEDPSVLLEFVELHSNLPQPQKIGELRTMYQSCNDFGELKSLRMMPMIADLGLAQRGHSSKERITPIQTDCYRAPEVILGAGWTYSTDIWNLGVLIWELLENKPLFTMVHSSDCKYNARTHLAEMIALLGTPPDNLLQRELEGREFRWRTSLENDEGKLCDRAIDFFGGPFFDSRGGYMYPNLIPDRPKLEDSITSLEGDEKQLFFSFIKKLLTWWPKDRRAAEELFEDPWLKI
ncbi:MAG: hypothetical protein M1820_001101 [Bogoriella megaspora]|nr:MAG: hypothetical protein M1820_001101 [Bogoriella megaspora]